MIKGVKPNGKFISGHYTPVNKDKYVGKYPIVFRSSWERKFCIYCDLNAKILKWASEPFEIPYLNRIDQRIHRYYPDFYFEALQPNDTIVKYIAEIKPDGQLYQPTPPKVQSVKKILAYNYQLKNYVQIMCKRDAAMKWAKDRGCKYVFLTEKSWKKIFK